MKLILILALFVTPLLAVNTVKKPGTPATKPRPAAPAAKPSAPNHTGAVTSAARAAVTAYLKSNDRMSPALQVTIKDARTEPMTGWAGRYVTSGTAEVYIPQAGSGLQRRNFNAYTTVSDSGAVQVTDVSVN